MDGGDAAAGFALDGAEEKGFAGAFPAPLADNGFEKGLAGADVVAPSVMPNNEAPILGWGFSSSSAARFSAFDCVLLLEPFAIRTPRMPRTLPSFLRHAFLRQVHT
jgi:hypothetical protein